MNAQWTHSVEVLKYSFDGAEEDYDDYCREPNVFDHINVEVDKVRRRLANSPKPMLRVGKTAHRYITSDGVTRQHGPNILIADLLAEDYEGSLLHKCWQDHDFGAARLTKAKQDD